MKNILFLILFVTASYSFAEEEVAKKGPTLTSEPSPFLKSLLKKYNVKKEDLSYSFQSLNNDKESEEFGALDPFIPASLTKVFTAMYALKNLSPDYQFITQIFYTGHIENGILKGDVYLRGTGDPSLTVARLMDLAMDLRSLGITKVQGNFFYDESEQPTILEISNYGNGDQTYNPGLSALNLEFNRQTLYKEGGRTKSAEFSLLPQTPHYQLLKSEEDFPIGARFRFDKTKGEEVWQVSNKQSYRTYEDIPVRYPSRRTSAVFRNLSELWGIQLPPPRQGITPKDAKLLGTNKSPPLLRLLALTLEYSNNLFAEQILLKASGKKVIKEAAEELTKWRNTQVPSCQGDLINGSGLTSQHKVTARCFVDFLKKYALAPVSGRGFMSLLSVNGQSGWLANRLRTPEESFRIWAKTGSLDYVSNITGVLFSQSGKSYAFALSIRDEEKRNYIDTVTRNYEASLRDTTEPTPSKTQLEKAEALKNHASRWMRQAKSFNDDLLKHFIQTL